VRFEGQLVLPEPGAPRKEEIAHARPRGGGSRKGSCPAPGCRQRNIHALHGSCRQAETLMAKGHLTHCSQANRAGVRSTMQKNCRNRSAAGSHQSMEPLRDTRPPDSGQGTSPMSAIARWRSRRGHPAASTKTEQAIWGPGTPTCVYDGMGERDHLTGERMRRASRTCSNTELSDGHCRRECYAEASESPPNRSSRERFTR